MYKHSNQRDMILEYLKGTKAHPTPEQIFTSLKPDNPELGIATVYRNLKALHSQGLIKKLNVGESCDRYDADISPHYHFLCECCGEVSDIYEPDVDIKFTNENGSLIKSFELYGYGICVNCKKSK